MMEVFIGMAVAFVMILLTVSAVFYIISCVKGMKALDTLMSIYEDLGDKLKDYMDDM